MGRDDDVEKQNFQLKNKYPTEFKQRERYPVQPFNTQFKQQSKSDYIRRHLYIKCCVNRNKLTIRNYTPKVISQEINMGMWM